MAFTQCACVFGSLAKEEKALAKAHRRQEEAALEQLRNRVIVDLLKVQEKGVHPPTPHPRLNPSTSSASLTGNTTPTSLVSTLLVHKASLCNSDPSIRYFFEVGWGGGGVRQRSV